MTLVGLRLFFGVVPIRVRLASRVTLVDFSQMVVARDVAPSVKILSETFADIDQQAIRVVYRLDAAPVNPEAIIVMTGLTLPA